MKGLSANKIQTYFDEGHPEKKSPVRIEEVGNMGARVRWRVEARHLRPGGTVSGPTLMALVDATVFIAILGELGPVLQTVTTNLNINFLKMPGHADILAECHILKLGKRLAFGEVELFSTDGNELVAHATCTYSIPPKK